MIRDTSGSATAIGLALLLGGLGTGCGRKDGTPAAAPVAVSRPAAKEVVFTDVTRAAGIEFVHTSGAFGRKYLPETMGAGLAFLDYDGDGRQDLFFVNGAEWPEKRRKAATQALYRNRGDGTFEDVTRRAGLAVEMYGIGVAVADFDNDGHVDLAVNSIGGKLILLRSTGGTGHWLEVKLPRFAPGAVVTVTLPDGRRLVQEVHAGSSYLSSEDPRLHFGLGPATRVSKLTVSYPNGKVTRMAGVPADRIVSAS